MFMYVDKSNIYSVNADTLELGLYTCYRTLHTTPCQNAYVGKDTIVYQERQNTQQEAAQKINRAAKLEKEVAVEERNEKEVEKNAEVKNNYIL